MSASPTDVTHGFTLSDPSLAWLILNGHKIIENRQMRFTPGWYAVHVSATAFCPIAVELPLIKEFNMPLTLNMAKGHVHGVCKIETGVPFEKCKMNRWAAKDYKIANIITAVIPFDKGDTVAARGALGNFPLKGAQERVNALTKQAIQLGLCKQTNAKAEFYYLLTTSAKEAQNGKAKRPAEEAPKSKATTGSTVKKTKRKTLSDPLQAHAPEPVKEAVVKADIRCFFLKKSLPERKLPVVESGAE